ncbi:MAG: hemerythrin family protein [Coriobacteriales bacterium]|nr:hemerythrin family protein [Coriobacteriales bacterium]
MVRLAWDPSMETGNGTIDHQHREMVELLNQAEAAEDRGLGDSEVRGILEQLAGHITDHFTMEQDLMQQTDCYPPEALEGHLEEHRLLTDRTREMILAYRAGNMDGVRPLTQFLWNWIIRHEYETDRKLVECIRQQEGLTAGADSQG